MSHYPKSAHSPATVLRHSLLNAVFRSDYHKQSHTTNQIGFDLKISLCGNISYICFQSRLHLLFLVSFSLDKQMCFEDTLASQQIRPFGRCCLYSISRCTGAEIWYCANAVSSAVSWDWLSQQLENDLNTYYTQIYLKYNDVHRVLHTLIIPNYVIISIIVK